MRGYRWRARAAADDGTIRTKMGILQKIGQPYSQAQIDKAPDELKDKTDMDAVIAFYRSVGFAVSVYDDGYAWVRTCGWEYLHLALAEGLEAGASSAAAFVHVGDVDDWRDAMRSNAPDVEIGDVIEQPWGTREYSITDPAGNVIRIGQNV